jgi:AcrR family transcriptional regulator
MPRMTRSQRQAQTRQDLLDAAARAFARRGFVAATIDEVADEASYTKGAVYSNFGSKEELFLAVLEQRLANQVEFFRGLAERARAEPDQDLAALLPRLNDTDEVWCLLEFEFWLYALRNPPIRARMAELYRQFRAQLAPIAVPFAGDDLEPEEVIAATIALYHGLTLQFHSDPDALRPDLVARVVRALGQHCAPGGSTRNGSSHREEVS